MCRICLREGERKRGKRERKFERDRGRMEKRGREEIFERGRERVEANE
jgi:hypothetical protein